MSQVENRNEWIFNKISSIIDDKEAIKHHYVLQMLNKTTSMFKYNGLPDTITTKDMEIQLQVGGHNTWKVVKDNLYTFSTGLGGKPNPYYLPTISIIANPALNYNESLEIDKDCVVMLNDHFYQGLMPLFSKYSGLLSEAEISLKYAIINARVPALVEADNDRTYKSAEKFFSKITEGKEYGVVASKEFFEGLKTHDFFKQPYIKDLIESIQYLKGSWYNEIGLNAAFNMKREAINEAEATLNEDILYPTVDTMLECRQIGLEKVNKMFGTDISVELNSVWKQNRVHEELVLENLKSEVNE